jgi:MerR family transcriptional regulator, heat shock protein HspR
MKEKFDNEKPIYNISSAARLLGISVHTLRMYEREGLIIPYKEPNHNRLFSENDIERLRCIRLKIQEKKYSINGIKAMLSLIPCWSVIHCSEEDRMACESYNQASKPCWMFKHENNICAKQDCRDCEVYLQVKCDDIKNTIKQLSFAK